MKKFLAIVLAAMMLLVCFAGCGKKQETGVANLTDNTVDNVYNGFAYETNEDGDYTIIGYVLETTKDSVLTIPTTINERPVTAIGDGAFKANLAKKINIPEGIVTIGMTAFFDCDNLTDVKLPSTVTSVGEAAFANCDKLVRCTLAANMTEIPDYMFRNCTALTYFTMTEKITSIGTGAFMGCTSLKRIKDIPAGLTSIGDCAFIGCVMDYIDLPASLTTIGEYILSLKSNTQINAPADSAILTYAQENGYKVMIVK